MPGDASSDSLLELWYGRAARQWVEALPIGNGRLGAMVFGGVGVERLQLNEDTLWSHAVASPLRAAGAPRALAAPVPGHVIDVETRAGSETPLSAAP